MRAFVLCAIPSLSWLGGAAVASTKIHDADSYSDRLTQLDENIDAAHDCATYTRLREMKIHAEASLSHSYESSRGARCEN